MEELRSLGFRVIVPREVIEELKDLRLNVGHVERAAIDVALQQFASTRIEKTKLGKRVVDEGLIAKGKQGAYIATLDAAIKRVVPNKIVITGAKNELAIERV